MGKTLNFRSNFGPKKCVRKSLLNVEAKDRISELPDEILVSILSLLPLKEAARTNVLSKRWMNLWTFTSSLDLCDDELKKNIEREDTLLSDMHKYVERVNHLLLKLHKSIELDLFRIAFPLSCSSQKDIDDWIKFALTRSVQRLELDLLRDVWWRKLDDKPYVFPDILLDHSYDLGFKSLKVLCFKGVSVTGQVLQFFLHNCPFLEELTVSESKVLISLEVSGPSLPLKHLEVCYCNDMKSIVIRDAINLVSLEVINAGSLWLENVPALVRVSVGCCYSLYWADFFSRHSSCLAQLSHFTLHISDFIPKTWRRLKFPQLDKLNELVFMVCLMMGNESLLGCTRLIRAAPFLKKVVFKVMKPSCVMIEKFFGNAKSSPLPNIEVVEICGYSSTSSELQLVKYFLENATALKKIIIDPRLHECSFTPLYEHENESNFRLLAKQQLEGVVVPPHVELVVL